MTIKEVNQFMERIKNIYQHFYIDDYKIEEWYKKLKDYNYEEVNQKLEEHMSSEKYGMELPQINFITRYLVKEKDKGKYKSSTVKVFCNICNKKIWLDEFNKHFSRCSSVEYLNNQSKKMFNKEIDKEKYRNMPEQDFNKIYNNVLIKVLETSKDKEEIDRINNYMIGNKEI